MKNIIYILVLTIVCLCSCTKYENNLLPNMENSNTGIIINFPHKSSASAVSSISSEGILIKKSYSLTDENAYRQASSWQSISLVPTNGGMLLSDPVIASGYNSYRAVLVKEAAAGFSTASWNVLSDLNDDCNDKLYKHFVGITRGFVDKTKPNSLDAEIEANPFVPSSTDENTFWGSSLAKSLLISRANTSSSSPNSFVLNKDILIEMSPMNSIVDMLLINKNKVLYLAVLASSKLFLIPPVSNVGESISRRGILNLKSILAGSKLSCKILALQLKPGMIVPNASADLSMEDIKNVFTVVNEKGEGNELIPSADSVRGNQRYYVSEDGSITGKQIPIVLSETDFIVNVNLLVLCNLTLEDSPWAKEDWQW